MTNSGGPPEGFPAPETGMLVSLFLIVADVDRAVAFYVDVLGGRMIRSRDPAVVQLANSWLILNPGGGPTSDKLRCRWRRLLSRAW